jgi:hypothetical protein
MLSILFAVAAQTLGAPPVATSPPANSQPIAQQAPAPTPAPAPEGAPESGPPRRPPFEFTAQIVLGGGARFAPTGGPAQGFFALAWRSDMLFGRTSPRAFGVGPALAVRLDHFADVTPSLGASVLFPVTEAFPLVLTPSFAVRWDGTSWAPGASGRLWWGVRSHNYHGVYALSIGLWVEGRRFFDPQNTTDIAAGVDIDLQALAIPFIALYVELFRRTRTQ